MIPAYMTVLHDPGNESYGDCLRACIRSLLSLSSDAVPHFSQNANGDVDGNISKFLDRYGLSLVTNVFFLADYGMDEEKLLAAVEDSAEDVLCMFFYQTMEEPDPYDGASYSLPARPIHSVIMLNGRLVHDPDPSGSTEKFPIKGDFYMTGMLVWNGFHPMVGGALGPSIRPKFSLTKPVI